MGAMSEPRLRRRQLHPRSDHDALARKRPLLPIEWADELCTWFTDVELRPIASGHPVDAADAASEVFERWPTASNAEAWQAAPGPDWPAVREHAIDRMRERPWELIAYLIDADDIARAWTEGLRAAENGTSLHPQQWDDLVDRYGKVDPVAVLPVMAQLIDDRLVEANTRAYPGAVRRMKKLRAAARAAGHAEIADEYLADARRRNARRPSLIQRMDAAGL